MILKQNSQIQTQHHNKLHYTNTKQQYSFQRTQNIDSIHFFKIYQKLYHHIVYIFISIVSFITKYRLQYQLDTEKQLKYINKKYLQILNCKFSNSLIISIKFCILLASIKNVRCGPNPCQYVTYYQNMHNAVISKMQLSINNKLFTISGDGNTSVWNFDSTSYEITKNQSLKVNHTVSTTNSFQFYQGLDVSQSDPNMFVTAGNNQTINIFNIQAGKYIQTNILTKTNLNSVQLNSSNTKIIVGGDTGILIYNFNGSNWNADPINNYDNINVLDFSLSQDNQNLLILNPLNFVIERLNLANSQYEAFTNISASFFKCKISDDSYRLIFAQNGGIIHVYDKSGEFYFLTQKITGISTIRDIFLTNTKDRLLILFDQIIYIYEGYPIFTFSQALIQNTNGNAYSLAHNTINNRSYIFVGTNQGDISLYKCCPLLYSDINNNCNCLPGYIIKDKLCKCNDSNGNETMNCACNNGYFLNMTNMTCLLCSNGCLSCTNASICTICDINYYLNTTNNNTICIICNIVNCISCTNQTCLQCQTNYSWNGNTCQKFNNCISSASNSCNGCLLSYLLNNNSCVSCAYGCLNCSDTNICNVCNFTSNYILSRYNNIQNCTCQGGYYSNLSNYCIKCANFCTTCTNKGCSQCVNNFFFDNTTQYCCYSNNCLNCSNNGNCSICNINFFANSSFNNSTINILNIIYCCNTQYCSSCINYASGRCDLCISGYYLNASFICLNGTQIKNCKNLSTYGCGTCLDSYYLDSNNYCCYTQNCFSCTLVAPICIKCVANYYLDVNSSCCNTDNCLLCSPTNSSCNKCIRNYFLNYDGNCLINNLLKNCQTSGFYGCLKCTSGFQLDAYNYCTNIINCNISNLYTGVCISCKLGYFIYTNGSCINFFTLKYCSANNQTACTSCKINTYFDQNLFCSSIQNCSISKLPDMDCSICLNNFYFDNNKSNCCNTNNCLNCSSNSNCTSCNPNFYMNNQYYCCQVTNCINCSSSTGICLTCIAGYTLDINKYCCPIVNCTSCSKNLTFCNTCIINYYFNNKICSPCPILLGCSICLNQTNCAVCNSTLNFILNSKMACICQIGYNLLPDQKCYPSVVNKLQGAQTIFQNSKNIIIALSFKKQVYQQNFTNTTLIGYYEGLNGRLLNTVNFNLTSISVTNNHLVSFYFSNPIISLNYITFILNINNVQISSNNFTFTSQNLLSQSQISSIYQNGFIQNIIIPIFMVIVLVLYVNGYKHNHVLNFVQKICFLRFNLPLQSLTTFQFLFNLKYCYYDYGTNPLLNILPTNYNQYSIGGFYLLSLDANIVRNLGVPIIISIVIAFIRIIFFFYQKFRKPTDQLSTIRIYFTRIIEFFQKSIMFPIIFFSLASLTFNYKNGIIPRSNSNTYQLSNAFASIYIAYFFFVAALIYLDEQVSKFFKLQYMLDYLFSIIDSIIILQTIYSINIFTIIVGIVFKGGLQVYINLRLLGVSKKLQWYKVIDIILEIALIGVLYLNLDFIIVLTLFILVIIIDLSYMAILLWKKLKYREEKQKQQQSQEVGQDSNNGMEVNQFGKKIKALQKEQKNE